MSLSVSILITWLLLDKEKSSKNVTSDPRLSFLHTAYLSKHPLVVDSLYEKWQLHLKQQSLSGTFALQLLVSIFTKIYISLLFCMDFMR